MPSHINPACARLLTAADFRPELEKKELDKVQEEEAKEQRARQRAAEQRCADAEARRVQNETKKSNRQAEKAVAEREKAARKAARENARAAKAAEREHDKAAKQADKAAKKAAKDPSQKAEMERPNKQQARRASQAGAATEQPSKTGSKRMASSSRLKKLTLLPDHFKLVRSSRQMPDKHRNKHCLLTRASPAPSGSAGHLVGSGMQQLPEKGIRQDHWLFVFESQDQMQTNHLSHGHSSAKPHDLLECS